MDGVERGAPLHIVPKPSASPPDVPPAALPDSRPRSQANSVLVATDRRPARQLQDAISRIAASSPAWSSRGNSSTPLGSRKLLSRTRPPRAAAGAPRRSRGSRHPEPDVDVAAALCRLPLTSRAGTSQVGGMLMSGMSMIVVTPPAAAAAVTVAKPSHSVRPGSLTCRWSRPGQATAPRRVPDRRRRRRRGPVEGLHGGDPPRAHPDRARPEGAADGRAPRPHHQVQAQAHGRPLRPASAARAASPIRSLAIIWPTRRSSGPASAMQRAGSGSRSASV